MGRIELFLLRVKYTARTVSFRRFITLCRSIITWVLPC